MPAVVSPLRYPGGKAKLFSTIRPIIDANLVDSDERIYIEPFAGGAGLALQLLIYGHVDRIILNDFDYCIYCFWKSCLHNTESLCKKIEGCDLTIDNWIIQKSIYDLPSFHSELDVGFATFFLNRCNVSGVIQGGPIGGMKQTGTYLMDARFNRQELIRRIQLIKRYSSSIEIFNFDASDFLENALLNYPRSSTILNIDPPYVKKGPLLYTNSFTTDDHVGLSNVIKNLEYRWILTYDDCELVRDLYGDYTYLPIIIGYSAGQTKFGKELLVLSNDITLADSVEAI